MQRFMKNAFLLAVASCALFASGCLSRQLVNFQTHPDQQTMLMETLDTRNYLVWSKHEHVHWSCTESDDTLQCTRRCGGKADLVCPTGTIFANTATTNVR